MFLAGARTAFEKEELFDELAAWPGSNSYSPNFRPNAEEIEQLCAPLINWID